MIQLRQAPLVVAMSACLLATLALPGYAAAQEQGSRPHRTAREARDAREGRAPKQPKAKAPEPLFPQATRDEPVAVPSRAGLKKLLQLQEDYQKQDDDATLAAAKAIIDDSASTPYEKSFAYLLAGTASANKDDQAAAAENFGKAIETNGLSNNDHYTAMFNLAVTQYGLERYKDALATLERFQSETKAEKPEADNLKGGILMSLDRFDEAAALYTKMLAAKPDDKALRMNAVAAYQSADKPEKAMELLAEAQAKGLLTTKDEYRALYVNMINADKDADALRVIEDGVAKGIVPASVELSKDYMVLGQKAYYKEDNKTAAEMYKRAAAMAADGEAALNLAKIYAEDGKTADSKAAAKLALDKGVKDTATAKRLAGVK